MLYRILTRQEFEMTDLGAVATIMVALAPQRLSLEPEKTAGRQGSAEPLGGQRGKEKRRGLSPSALRVNHRGAEVPLAEIGSGGRIRTCDQVVNSHLRYRCATPESDMRPGRGPAIAAVKQDRG